jgi:polyribonucleotide nucleotidyltransferase
MFKIKEKTIDLGDGRQIVLETGRLARQADGAVLLKMGKTMLLATVVAAKEAKEDTDFMHHQAVSLGGFSKEKPGLRITKYLYHVW